MPAKIAIPLPLGPVQPRRLLDIIPRLPASSDEDANPLRWLEGVTWEPWPCRGLTTDDDLPCTPEDLTVTPHQCEGWLTQLPFRISDAMSASLSDFHPDEIRQRLTAIFNRSLSAAFATELISGNASGGHSLSTAATEPNGAAFGASALPVWNALAVLEEEIAERLQGEIGFIHLAPGLLAQAVSSYGLRLNANGIWETPAGNLLISDAGYLDPEEPVGEAASAAGESWVYASGPVWFETSFPTLPGADYPPSTMYLPRNVFTEYIAAYGILVFDLCPVTAVLASYDVN